MSTELTEDFNPIMWWSTAPYPSLLQWAFDTLSCPATSCEWERVFSSAMKLITPVRNKLEDTIIEAAEYLKAWFDKGLVKRGEDVFQLSIANQFYFILATQKLTTKVFPNREGGYDGLTHQATRPARPTRPKAVAWTAGVLGSLVWYP
jgi:hypothetical protein